MQGDYLAPARTPRALRPRAKRRTVRTVRAAEAVTARLTPREKEILRCLIEGLSTEAIAGRLFISRTTVRNHVQHILPKLGVHSKLAAAALARRRRLV